MTVAPAVNISIRQLRDTAGITQLELAERLGVSQPAVARWESGRRMPRLDTLQRIADALGLNLSVIFSAASPPEAPPR